MTQAHIPVLDHGFVALESHMGSDLTVVNAARVSFAKRSNYEYSGVALTAQGKSVAEPQARLKDADVKLIRYLAWHEHWTPFGHPQITLRLKMPIFVARQWMRSNVGIVYNEVSRRYVDDPPELHSPLDWRSRPTGSMKQGSGPIINGGLANDIGNIETWAAIDAVKAYNELVQHGVAPEQARIVLPVSMYTEFWMTGSLAAMARVVGLRIDPHAQWEVQEYARTAGRLIEPLFPVSWPVLLEVHEEVAAFRRRRYAEKKESAQ